MNWLRQRPWLPFVAAFAAFVIWWGCFIFLAVKHQPPPLEPAAKPSQHHAGH